MKINGKKLDMPKPRIVAIPRDGENDIVFVCNPVVDFSTFEEIFPEPKPPIRQKPGQPDEKLVDDPVYLGRLNARHDARMNWMMIESLAGTPNLEWETIVLSDPTTYHRYEKELKEFLSPLEFNLVINGIMDANMPSEGRRKEAMERFTASQRGVPSDLTSQKDAQDSTPSGELASE